MKNTPTIKYAKPMECEECAEFADPYDEVTSMEHSLYVAYYSCSCGYEWDQEFDSRWWL